MSFLPFVGLLLRLPDVNAAMRPTLRLLSPSSTSASTAWETVIGLELHVQIKSPYKLFSRSFVSFPLLLDASTWNTT
jgi:hypothetical protein